MTPPQVAGLTTLPYETLRAFIYCGALMRVPDVDTGRAQTRVGG